MAAGRRRECPRIGPREPRFIWHHHSKDQSKHYVIRPLTWRPLSSSPSSSSALCSPSAMSTSSPTTTLTDGGRGTHTPTSTSSQSESSTATLYLYVHRPWLSLIFTIFFLPPTMNPTSFTFLATILILVLLSASLVLRSYILRRRYRERFQQALADGLFADLDRNTFDGQFDPLGGFRRSARQLGPKPVVWDTWTHPADKVDTWSSITVSYRATSSPIYPMRTILPTAGCCALHPSAIVIDIDIVVSSFYRSWLSLTPSPVPSLFLLPTPRPELLFPLSPSTLLAIAQTGTHPHQVSHSRPHPITNPSCTGVLRSEYPHRKGRCHHPRRLRAHRHARPVCASTSSSTRCQG